MVLFAYLLLAGGMFTMSKAEPSFSSKPITINAVVGDDISFLCRVKDRGEKFVSWLRGYTILTVGKMVITPDKRISVRQSDDSSSFQLNVSNITVRDEGHYTCQIGTVPPVNQRNVVVVYVPPTIRRLGPQVIESSLGKNVSLKCNGDGKPKPTIVWTKNANNQKERVEVGEGSYLVLRDIGPRDAGTYTCTASNGIAVSAIDDVTLTLKYPPIINISKHTVRSARGLNVELHCDFYAEPAAKVTWHRGGKLLTEGIASRQLDGYTHRSVYYLKNVVDRDFTTYDCVIRNDRGHASQMFSLTGLPETPTVVSKEKSDFSNVYSLRWKVKALERPVTFEILMQKLNKTALAENWSKIEKPATNGDVYSHTFQGLDPQSSYAVIIRAKNHFGWSEFSDVAIFTTNSEGYTPLPRSLLRRHDGEIIELENESNMLVPRRLIWLPSSILAIQHITRTS